jgi:FkbM family methyltransferase
VRVIHLEGTRYAWGFELFGQTCYDLGVKPRHVLHVGGHLGQELPHYRAAGVEHVTYVEPTPDNAARLRRLGDDAHGLDVTVIEAAAGAVAGYGALLECGGDGAWNTMRSFIGTGEGVHDVINRQTVRMITVRDLQMLAAHDGELPYDVLVVDTQGTEVEVLGAADLGAPALRLVIVETQSSGHPEAAHVADVNEVMAAAGWEPVVAWNHERAGAPHETFADVLYVRAEGFRGVVG